MRPRRVRPFRAVVLRKMAVAVHADKGRDSSREEDALEDEVSGHPVVGLERDLLACLGDVGVFKHIIIKQLYLRLKHYIENILKTHDRVSEVTVILRSVRKTHFGRGDDTVGNPHRAQICQFEYFEPILLLKFKQFPVERFEATVSQSTGPSPLLHKHTCAPSRGRVRHSKCVGIL